jgi:hypothetical protein
MNYHQKYLSSCLLATAFAALLYSPSPGMAAAFAPSLGSAESFAVLGGSTVTNTGATIVTGDLGVSTPGVACTGFVGCTTTGPGKVIGNIHVADPIANAAQSAALVAYNQLVGQTCDFNYPAVAEIGGLTLSPGVHCFPSSAQVTGKLTLSGGPSSVYVFKIGSTLTTGPNASVVFQNGVDTNVFWAVGSSATLGTGTAFTGSIFAVASITLTTGATVSGRVLARAAVTMDTNTVASTCPSSPCAHPLPVPPRGRDVTQLLLDHFQCYQVKPEDKVQPHEVVLQDQFGKSTVTLKRPWLICAPAIKNADPAKPGGKFPDDLRNPIDHLVCYRIHESGGKDIEDEDESKASSKGATSNRFDMEDDDASSSDRREVSVDNQFGVHRLTVKKPRLLCVPSLKTVLQPHGDGGKELPRKKK